MRRLNMHIRSQAYKRDQNIQNQIKNLRQEDDYSDAAIKVRTITNMLELEEYNDTQQRIKSKRNLLNMLSL